MLDAKLAIVGGDAKKADIRFRDPMMVGRGSDCTLPIRHKLVSRKHCEIFEQKGMLYVRDLDSLNGTFIDSERIKGTRVLQPNQLLTIGNITFRAIYEPGKQIEPVSADPIPLLDAEPINGAKITASPNTRLGDATVYQPPVPHLKNLTQDSGHSESQEPEGQPADQQEAAIAEPILTENSPAKDASEQPALHVPGLPNESRSDQLNEEAECPVKESTGSFESDEFGVEDIDDDIFDEVLDDHGNPANTDPSIVVETPGILEDSNAEEKSISLSGIAELSPVPVNDESISRVDLHDDLMAKPRQVSAQSLVGAEFFDEDKKDESKESQDSRLGSFIRNLPK